MNQLTNSQAERFFGHVMPITESGCWIWMGSTSPKGYGKFNIPDRTTMVHRLSYEHFKGSIPQGVSIDHVCRVRCCVNPDHLHLCSNQENVLSGYGVTAVNARKTHCPKGHAYTKENTRYYEGRNCRECHRIKRRAERSRKTAPQNFSVTP